MIWHIYKKEMLDSLRDRKTILLGIFIPIVMILALALFYEMVLLNPDTDETHPVAVSADEETLQWLSALPGIEPFPSAAPEQDIQDGKAVAGVRAASGFLAQVEGGGTGEIELLADWSSMKASSAMNAVKDGLNGLREDVVARRLAEAGIDAGLVQPIVIREAEIQEGDSVSLYLASLLLPLLVIMAVMIGGQSSAVELFAGEKERKTMEALLMTPVNRSALILAKWLTITTLGFISGIFAVASFVVVVATMTERLKQVLDFGDQAVNLVASALLCILLFSMLVSAIQIIFSLFANNFKEAQSYFGPVMFIALVPYAVLIGTGVNELTAVHFLIPVMNTFALLKELVYGVFRVGDLVLTLLSTAATVAVMYTVASIMFRRDKWVLGK